MRKVVKRPSGGFCNQKVWPMPIPYQRNSTVYHNNLKYTCVTLTWHMISGYSPLHDSSWCLAFLHRTKNNQVLRFSPISPTSLLGFLFSPSNRAVWLHACKPWPASPCNPSRQPSVSLPWQAWHLAEGKRNPAHYKQSPQPNTYFSSNILRKEKTQFLLLLSSPQDDPSFLTSWDTATHIRNIHIALQGL